MLIGHRLDTSLTLGAHAGSTPLPHLRLLRLLLRDTLVHDLCVLVLLSPLSVGGSTRSNGVEKNLPQHPWKLQHDDA